MAAATGQASRKLPPSAARVAPAQSPVAAAQPTPATPEKTAPAFSSTGTFSLVYKGFNYVADINGSYANANSLPAVVSTGANSVALTTDYGINPGGQTIYEGQTIAASSVYVDQDYTDLSDLGPEIAAAESAGLTVTVRPLIDFTSDQLAGSDAGDWRETWEPSNIGSFFTSYGSIILAEATIAQENGAQIFDIGTELDQLGQYTTQWDNLIKEVRQVFKGELTYSAMWDAGLSHWTYGGGPAGTGNFATQISFWQSLDFVGIDEYATISDIVPTSSADNPSLATLIDGWTEPPTDATVSDATGGASLISYFEGLSTDLNKPLLFTEIGYLDSTDGDLANFDSSTNVEDDALQGNLYTAFFDAWQQDGNSALQGAYFWNWEPDASNPRPGGINWSPQGLPAQEAATKGFAACYRAGTRIATPAGETPIEHLTIGGRVTTASGAVRKIKWIGWRRDAARLAANPNLQPILFRAGALADAIPRRDLYVSPNHAMLVDGVLVPAELLINGRTILQTQIDTDITYLHVELASHDVLLAEGAPSESFVDCDSRAMFDNAHEFAELYPDDAAPRWTFCAPRIEAGETLAAIRRRLADRAGLSADHTEDAPSEGPPDGRIDTVEDGKISGWAFDATRPNTPVRIELLADDTVLAELTANAFRADLKKAGKGEGRCAFTCQSPAANGTLTLRRATDRAVIALRP